MKIRLVILSFLTLFSLVFSLNVLAQDLNVETEIEIMFEDAADPWSKSDGTGYANDIVEAAFQAMNIKVKKMVVPYSRCKQMVLVGRVPACVSMTWLPEFKGLVELAKDPLIVLNADIFENKSKPLPRPIGSSCKLPPGKIIGVVRGYEYPPETMALRKQSGNWVISGSDSQSLQRLALERLDAAVVITNDLEPRNQKAVTAQVGNKVAFAFHCGTETGTIGFSLKHPKGIWARDVYKEGYRRIKENGLLDKIHEKWAPLKEGQKRPIKRPAELSEQKLLMLGWHPDPTPLRWPFALASDCEFDPLGSQVPCRPQGKR